MNVTATTTATAAAAKIVKTSSGKVDVDYHIENIYLYF